MYGTKRCERKRISGEFEHKIQTQEGKGIIKGSHIDKTDTSSEGKGKEETSNKDHALTTYGT